jgi:hypothetical protein
MPRGVSEACWLRAQKTPAESRSKRRCRSRQAAFLIAYRKTASITAAAKAAQIGEPRHYQWLKEDPRYWRSFSEAQQEVADVLQDKAVERAVEGWLEPVFYRGRQCGTTRRHSDRLLIVLAKAWMPEKYRYESRQASSCPTPGKTARTLRRNCVRGSDARHRTSRSNRTAS